MTNDHLHARFVSLSLSCSLRGPVNWNGKQQIIAALCTFAVFALLLVIFHGSRSAQQHSASESEWKHFFFLSFSFREKRKMERSNCV